MVRLFILLVVILSSCGTTKLVERNRHKKTTIKIESFLPINFNEIMDYDHPRWDDEQYSYKFKFIEKDNRPIPIGQKISLQDTVHFNCDLGFWSPWKNIVYKHHSMKFEGWIEIINRTDKKILLNHEVIAIRNDSRKIIFSGRIGLK